MQTALKDIESMRRTVPARRLIPAYRTKKPDLRRFSMYFYEQVKAMINKAAKTASSHSGVPFEEMKAQADYLFVSALQKFDITRGVKFSTFLYSVLHNGLVDYGKHESRHNGWDRVYLESDENGETTDIVSLTCDEAQERQYDMINLYNSLSPDQEKLVKLVLDGFASSIDSLRILARERFDIDQERFQVAVAGIKERMGELLA